MTRISELEDMWRINDIHREHECAAIPTDVFEGIEITRDPWDGLYVVNHLLYQRKIFHTVTIIV